MERPRRRSSWAMSLLALIFASQAMMVNGQMQSDGDLRLTGFESSRLAGTVEMHFFGQWYTICNDFFTLREAAVVCRQLGLGYPVRIFNQDTDGPDKMTTSDSPVSRFGFGSGIHAMDDVSCTGEEPHILSCSYGVLGGAHNCAIWESVGVQCSDLYPQPYSGQVRLEGGEFPSSGRLEVYFSGQWGAVCGEGTLDANLPTTVCRQLGFSSGTGQAVRYTQSVPVWLTSVSCSSSSTCLSSCLASTPAATQTCSNNTYISISCAHDAQPVRDYGTKDRCEMTSSNPGEGSLRLVGGATNNTGVVQVYLSGRWGGICASGIRYDNESLDVACRQLGYRSWHSAGSATFTNSPINIGRLTVDCNGGEQKITDCNIVAEVPSSCSLQFHLTCSTDWAVRLYGGVLLTGGGGASGTLAVNGIGSLCDSPFSLATGDVVCRQMGYEGARAVKKGSFYGLPAFEVGASGVCSGSEQNLTACRLMNCSGTPATAAGVQCIVNSSDIDRGNLRLVGGNSTAGRLQMQLNGEWTQVCSDGFSPLAANVACSQLLGLGSTGTVHTDGRYGNTNTGTVVVQRCIGTEAKLYDCWYYSVDSRLCTSDVAVECKQGECSIICENGGTLTSNCTCVCANGFSGVNCSMKRTCGQPARPSNGRVNTSAGTFFGDVARYSCDTGYTLNGTAERRCQANGEWSGSVPTCERVSCGQPDDPSNGRVDTSAGTSFGDVARYSCDTGYTRNGPAERTCQADGQWSGSAPTCERVSCGQPASPSNGSVDTSAGTSFGDVARYSCDTGYTVNGTAERTCQANGDWSGSVPTCERGVCGEPDALHNGRVGTSAGTSFGDVARYSCDTGYTLNGTAERTCQANREWSGSVPTCEKVSCGQPDAPHNGSVDASAGTSFGDVARYSCDTGYMLIGTAERTCQADGRWSGSVPTCKRDSCGQPGILINGRVNTSAGTSFGDVARYSCDVGYMLIGLNETTCQADGQWNGSVPTCEEVSCGQPDTPSNGRVDTSAGTSFSDVARYSCYTGYTRNGTAERTCQADGQWSGIVPTCERVSCGGLVNPNDGRVDTSSGTSFGDVARYSCDTGYTLNGPAKRTCQADGRWNGSVPTCERGSCGPPDSPSNGRVDTSAGTSFGDVARYSCDEGYMLIGLNETTCQADGQWNGSVPTCEKVSCGQPVSPSNGRVDTSAGTSFGDVARYSCDEGYMLIGLNETTCQADGQWNGSVPTCERVSCNQLVNPSNGRVDTSAGTSVGDVARYSCDTGYTLNGTAERTCQDNGEWSGSVPTCETVRVFCGQPGIPSNGRVDTSAGTSVGDVARYSCDKGYMLIGLNETTCQADGQWNGSVPTCEVVECDIPQSFPNGTITLVNGSTTLNSTVKYDCKTGFQLVGSANRICQSNEQWSGQEPMCERVSCGEPDSLSNGRVDTSAGTSFGDVARYSCNTGYTLNGTAETTCQANREWSRSLPTCELVSCDPLDNPNNGRVDTSAGTSFGDVARYSCNTGYTVSGPAERTCQANGEWSGSVPTCERGICSQPGIPSNGHVDTSAGTSFGNVARYSCDRGYTRNGPAERTCQANGQWSGSVPTCEIVDCGTLETITNGNVLVNGGTTFSSIAMYNCSSGYHLVGMVNRVCQSSGQWNGSAPRCDRNFCPQSFFFPLGVPKTPASTQARMSCSELDDSFLPDGTITALCSNDGIWDPLDMSQCTFRKDAPVAAVAVVETPLTMIEAMGAFIEFGHVTPLSMLDNQTVLTIRMNSDNERNDFNVFILNGSTPISKLLVSQKKDSCNCCDFSAVEVLRRVPPSSSALPTPAISDSFNVCTGLPEAPQACTCSNRRLACLRRFSFTSSSRLCSLDVDEDGVVDTEDSCVGCCLPSFDLAFQWPRTLHRTTAELDCSKIHDSFSDTKVRRRCLPDDSWGPADISSCTFKNRTRNPIFLLSTNVTISGERNREDVLDEIQTIFENQLPNLTDVATLSNSSYNITTLTVQSSTRNGSSVTTVVFIVDFQNNVTLSENAMAVVEKIPETTYTFGDLVGVTPSNSCPCRAGGGQIAHLCLGNSLSPCDCTDLGTCECIDPYINDTVTKQCSLDTDGDMIPDYRDSCKAEFGKDETGCPPSVPSTEGCPAETDTDWKIEWPVAAIGSTQSVRCPGEGDVPGLGLAHRSCLTGRVWGSVNASDCGSVAVREVSMQRENFVNSLQESNSTNLALTPDQRMVIQNISESLNAALEPSDDGGNKTIPPRDLKATAEVVKTIADLGENNDLFDAENNETQEVVADILSNVLDERNSPAFEATATDTGTAGAQGGETASPATSILQSTERVANVIVNTLSVKRRITISRPNLGLHGERFPLRRAGGFTFPGPGVMLPQFRRPESIPQIRFPRAFLFAARGIEMPSDTTPPTPTTSSEVSPALTTSAASPSPTPATIPTIVPPVTESEDIIEVVNVVMNNMENYLPTDVEDVEASDVEAEETQAASLVFSSQIPGYDGGEVNTTETVEITFPLIEQATNLTVPPGRRKQFRCAFFNFTGGANRTGGWSYSGVQTEVINETHVRCNAAHLTSFVVLVSIVPAADTPVDPLDYITYIGCSISFLCLLACIAFFISLRKELITKLHNFVHLNLCIALALGLLLFLTGIQTATANVYACKIVTAFLHYFFLATFTWTLCEAVLIYILLVKVFGANEKKWICLYLALGWVLPIPIVVISGGVRNKDYLIRYSFNESHPNYDKFKACWLPTEHYTIFAFIGPMVAIIVVNAVLLTISLGSLAKSQFGKTTSEMKPEKNERRKEFMEVGKRLFKATIILVPVMGFTWIIGLFAVGEEGKVFAYLFVIANAFQGLFIFIFHVLRHEKVYGKIKSCLPKLKGISTSTGTASTAGSSRSRSNKSKWVDSKKSTSVAAESEAFIEYGEKKEDDAVSIHEGGDLEMKLKSIDETTEGQGQGDNEVDKPVAVANTSFEASTSAEGALDEEEKGKDDEDKLETDPCDVDQEQAKGSVMPTSTATTFGVQSDNKAANDKDSGSSEDN